MEIRPIRNDDDHRAALQEIERLWAYPNTSPENDKLDVLATLVEVYKSRRWPTRGCSQIKILQYAVSDMGRTRAELADLLGSRFRASGTAARQAPHLTRHRAEDQPGLGHSDPTACGAL